MPKGREPLRLDARSAYRLFIGGAFVPSASGRSELLERPGDESASVARASREDVAAAVSAAGAGAAQWAGYDASRRGRALYRLAERLDARRTEIAARLAVGPKPDEAAALRETATALDRTLWYAGWCDKYAALLSARNPVAGPYHNHTQPEPLGVVGVVAPDEPAFLGLVSVVLPPLVSGNAVVALASETDPRPALLFAELLGTSDLPPGSVNVLTGQRIELAPHLARQAGVAALDAPALEGPFAAELERLDAERGARTRTGTAGSPAYWYADDAQDLAHIAAFTGLKTVWHPTAV